MSERIVDAILNATEVNAGASPALDINYGGMMGATPRYGFLDPNSNKYYGEWISATPYVRENVIPVLITYPKFMDWLTNKEKWIGMTKAALEVLPQSIDGLKSTLVLDVDATPTGGAGDQFEVPVNMTKEVSSVNYNYKERAGRPISKFFNFWGEYGIMDAYTKRAKVLKYLDDPKSNKDFTMYTPDFYTATVLYIEPGNQFTTVEKAWLVFNMFPKTYPPVEGSRDITTSKQTLDISIEFAGIAIATDSVIKLAESILPRMVSLFEISDYDLTLPVGGFNPTVKDNKESHGFIDPQGNGDLAYDTHKKP